MFKHHAIKMHEGVVVELHAVLTPVLDGYEGSDSRHTRSLYPWRKSAGNH
jgi:hypothetical protein